MTVPFRALLDGEIVVPEQVDDQQVVECPECRGILYPRDGDQRARHFFHASDDDSEACSTASGGESDTHARCTALTVAALAEQFPTATHVGAEITIDVTGTATAPETRRTDAFVEFQEENPYFGRGLIIEVQHKHHSKDIEGTTHDHLAAGYSVAWLTPDDFGDEQLDYDVVDDAFRADDGHAYSIREHDPWEFETRVEVNLEWEPPSRKCFPYAETGSHDWRRIPSYAHPDSYEYEFCRGCGSRRQYDQTLTRFVYDYEGVLAPEVRIDELRDAIIIHREVADDFEGWLEAKRLGPDPTFETVLVNRVDVAPCRGPRGVHEWDRKEVIERGYDDRVDVALWECRYCPVHLLMNHTGAGETVPILFGEAPDPEWGLDYLFANPRRCGHRSHRDQADWDDCPSCRQLNP
ncbi:hypothetical protein [Halorarius halobius]|uniref:hypothetical protein n=1 Tax=Halorarius halobius TaxID=2962671 RepID=UPI0020CFAA69|nr:hypothetical protein [Halorarius halobius]